MIKPVIAELEKSQIKLVEDGETEDGLKETLNKAQLFFGSHFNNCPFAPAATVLVPVLYKLMKQSYEVERGKK